MKVKESELVEVKLVSVSSGQGTVDVHGVEVVCLGEGQTTVTLTVGNTRSSALPYPHTVCCIDNDLMITLLSNSPHFL